MLGVFLGHLAFGLHHKFAAVHKDIHYVHSFVEESAAVAAKVEHHAFEVFVLVFKTVESRCNIGSRILGELVEFDISEIAVHKAEIRNGLQFYLLAGYLYVVGFALTFYFHRQRGACLSAKGAANVGNRLAFGRFAVDFQNLVAGFESCFGSRKALVRLGDYNIVAAQRHHGAYAAVLSENLQFHVLYVGLGYVVGVRVEGGEHGVDGRFHKLAAFEFVNIVEVQVFVHIGENFEVL